MKVTCDGMMLNERKGDGKMHAAPHSRSKAAYMPRCSLVEMSIRYHHPEEMSDKHNQGNHLYDRPYHISFTP